MKLLKKTTALGGGEAGAERESGRDSGSSSRDYASARHQMCLFKRNIRRPSLKCWLPSGVPY